MRDRGERAGQVRRTARGACLLRVTLLACVASGGTVRAEEPRPRYDHHVHVLSPQLIGHWKSVGMTFSRKDQAYSDPVFFLENERLEGVFLVSMAHLYATDGFRSLKMSPADEHKFVAAENDFVAACVAQAPDRFLGFFSVSPLRDYARGELERCKAVPHLTGLKLHLPACGVDLADPAHAARLAAVLGWAAAHDVPVLLHLSGGERIEPEAADTFWGETIAPHDGLELYLAHLGTAGGFNASSRNLLASFRARCARDEGFRERRIYFDLSGAIIPEGTDEAPPTSDESCRQLSDEIRQVGIPRFLFASDYPVFSISESSDRLRKRLVLNEEEVDRLLRNRSPRFDRK